MQCSVIQSRRRSDIAYGKLGYIGTYPIGVQIVRLEKTSPWIELVLPPRYPWPRRIGRATCERNRSDGQPRHVVWICLPWGCDIGNVGDGDVAAEDGGIGQGPSWDGESEGVDGQAPRTAGHQGGALWDFGPIVDIGGGV